MRVGTQDKKIVKQRERRKMASKEERQKDMKEKEDRDMREEVKKRGGSGDTGEKVAKQRVERKRARERERERERGREKKRAPEKRREKEICKRGNECGLLYRSFQRFCEAFKSSLNGKNLYGIFSKYVKNTKVQCLSLFGSFIPSVVSPFSLSLISIAHFPSCNSIHLS